MSLTCSICANNFSSKTNLAKHFKNVHKTKQTKNVTAYDFEEFNNKCLEQDCNTSYRFLADLRHHLQQMHSYAIEEEILKFSSEKEFQTWFKDHQESNNLSYVRNPSLNKNKIYFNCNRSGKVELKTHSRKRALKSQGSCKIGYNCINQIILTSKSDNTYEAMHCKTHYGHALQIHHVRLPLQTRIDVATKLTNGVSVTKVLDMYYKTNFNEKMLTRTNLITRQDIKNIKTGSHCLVTLANERINSKNVVVARESIATELNKMQNNINECPDEKLCNLTPCLLKSIKNINSLLTCNNSSMAFGSSKEDSLTASSREPANKKIKKQTLIFLTEKNNILSEHDYY